MRNIIAAVLSFCLIFSLTGCTKTQSNHQTQTSVQNTAPSYTPLAELDENILALLSRNVSFGQDDFSALETHLAGIRVTYPCEELYGVMDAYEKYTALPQYTSTHENYFSDGVFTAQELYGIVKLNNAAEGFMPNQTISDSDLEYVCTIIAPVLLEYGQKMSASDAALLSEKVSELKIFTFSGFAAGSYDSNTGRFGLDMNLKEKEEFTRTVQHETHHMLQSSSLAEREAGGYENRYGFSYIFDEEEDQPLNFLWMTEGSAELLTHNRLDSREYDVYESIIKTINYIKVATILRPDLDETSFETLSLSADFDGLFRYFDCQTEEEKQEYTNMMAAINYMYDLQFCSDAFEARCQQKYGEALSSDDLRSGVISSLGTALSREFFRNLTAALKDQTLTVEDLFTLNVLFEHRVCDYSLYRGPEKCADMLLSYHTMQTQFFAVLAEKLAVSVDELYAAYDVYYTKAQLQVAHIRLISAEEAAFLQYTTDTSVNRRYDTVNRLLN